MRFIKSWSRVISLPYLIVKKSRRFTPSASLSISFILSNKISIVSARRNTDSTVKGNYTIYSILRRDFLENKDRHTSIESSSGVVAREQ